MDYQGIMLSFMQGQDIAAPAELPLAQQQPSCSQNGVDVGLRGTRRVQEKGGGSTFLPLSISFPEFTLNAACNRCTLCLSA